MFERRAQEDVLEVKELACNPFFIASCVEVTFIEMQIHFPEIWKSEDFVSFHRHKELVLVFLDIIICGINNDFLQFEENA